MTEDRLEYLENVFLPNYCSQYRVYFDEILQEVKRARRSEKICRAAAQIYKARLQPVKLVMRKTA